mmetsp:Transcript_2948/g.5059  ORF Transcript_2948/g.5059 Transcript_2948/m.5059 type:complete len:101 (-) Transcript_2948:1173-1475(-)
MPPESQDQARSRKAHDKLNQSIVAPDSFLRKLNNPKFAARKRGWQKQPQGLKIKVKVLTLSPHGTCDFMSMTTSMMPCLATQRDLQGLHLFPAALRFPET